MRIVFLVLLLTCRVAAQDYVDVVYGGWSKHKLDIYLPDTDPPYPVVVYIHSGGWSGGDKAEAALFAGTLNDAGYACVAINYRLSGQSIFPAQIHDCKGAVRWLRANGAAYELDPTWIAAWGWSAGGHLAALLGTSAGVAALEGNIGMNLAYSSRVDAVIDFSGPVDLLMMKPDVTYPPGNVHNHDAPNAPASKLIGFAKTGQGIGVLRNNPAKYPAKYALAVSANPITHVTADDPPFFIAHGTLDAVVPVLQSWRLVSALDAAGLDVDYMPVTGGLHQLPTAVDAAAVVFLDSLQGAMP